jgi:cytochrome c2
VLGRKQFVVWLVLALAAIGLLLAVIVWRRDSVRRRFTSFVTGDPARGAQLFQDRGCRHCHAIYGEGGRIGPSLSSPLERKETIDDLVASMWNHAPAMWERMEAEKLPRPQLDEKDVSDLLAFLYVTRYLDEPGNPLAGRKVFVERGCGQCHAVSGEGPKIGPDLTSVGADTPITWTQTMWNHAPQMELRMRGMKVAWPRFEGSEMNDLLAYVRSVSTAVRREYKLLPADPDRGRAIFEAKGCVVCHSVDGAPRGAPTLGPGSKAPTTIVQFAGAMWNHSPEMWRVMQGRHIQRPTFEAHEMADLIAYLYSTRYFNPPGSAQKGRALFGARGCAGCHGAGAEGSGLAPALRVRGRSYSAITLAAVVWQHGPEMQKNVAQLGKSWPTLKAGDVADLTAFLNATDKDGK